MIILPPNIRIFPVSFAVITTDKPANRSIHAYRLTVAGCFYVKGVYLL